jgi:hypothetical protein
MAEVFAASIVKIFSAPGKIFDAPRSFACLIYQDRLTVWGAHLHAILPQFCTFPDCVRTGLVSRFSRGNDWKNQAGAGSIRPAIETIAQFPVIRLWTGFASSGKQGK